MQSYHDILTHVIENGERHEDRTGVGTLSVFGYQFRHDMRTGFPLLTTKRIPLRWVFEELRWFLSGSTSNHELKKKGVDIWDEWSDEVTCALFGRPPGELGPIYGKLWREFGRADEFDVVDQPGCNRLEGVDQIEQLIEDIQNSPNSRRLIVSGWHPFLQKRVSLPPCHTLWQIKCHEHDKTMSLHLYARSIDAFLGLPFNIASYGLLLEMIAYVTNYGVRDLIISFGDLHLYSNHLEQAKKQLSRKPFDLPNLTIDESFVPAGTTPLKRLLNLTWENMVLKNYKCHPKIKADVAI